MCHSPRGIYASQRFRLEQYTEYLNSENIEFTFSPFFSKGANKFLYKKGGTLKKVVATLTGFGRRFLDIFKMGSYDYVHVIREAIPIGPPISEWFAAKVLGKKIIYEFDDAVWMKAATVNNTAPRNKGKAASICKWSHKVVGGNDFLVDYGKTHNENTQYIPTTIDLVNHHNKQKQHSDTSPVTIGWTGTFSNLPFLDEVVPALRKINERKAIRFLVICNQAPSQKDAFIDFVEWRAASEIEDLMQIDIGLMPLSGNEWNKGKCGFKILQYLALGIPAVASPVGVNATIIEEGVNGFLCNTEDQWLNSLEKLIDSADLRNEMGQAGREKVRASFSVEAWKSAYRNLYRD